MKIAKSRSWTDAEVQEAIEAIKKEPGLWEELEYIEKTTGDFRDTELGRRESAVLLRLHPGPGYSFHEMTQLYGAVRAVRRALLGLK